MAEKKAICNRFLAAVPVGATIFHYGNCGRRFTEWLFKEAGGNEAQESIERGYIFYDLLGLSSSLFHPLGKYGRK
jgi:hypothetical protein